MANHASTNLNSKTLMFTCNMKNGIIIIIIIMIIFTIIININPFAPEPPVTARADPGPFYPL